ncbi:F-box/LRR-repeat protein 2-like [Periplaneta americana]|uniref:F-box/LRR-repeat protein 2-like n=1 Tax=Periplaneta americana TaxID=6978 RepID=UPI0037E779FE
METGKCFDDLPNELLLHIFSYLSIEDLALSIQHVNLRWKEVSHDDKLWKNAIFEPGDTLTDEDVVQHLKNMPALRAFSATQGTKMKLLIDTLCNSCREVQRLDLHKTYMLRYPSLKKLVQNCPHLEYLSLPLPRTMSAQLQSAQLLGQCKSLTTLSFDGSHGYVVKGMLEPVADGCPSLQHIHLGYCEFSADDIRYLLEKKKHQLLSFSAKFFFFTGIFKFLSECTKLEHLHIENDNDNLTYDDIHPLKQLTNLKYFALQYCTLSVASNLHTFFQNESFSKVIHLDVSHNFAIMNSDLNTVFKYVPFLQHLNVSSCHCLGDTGFEDIGVCSQLETLNISRCYGLTDKSMEYVSKGCTKLKCLDLSSCNTMTDDVMLHIVKCKKLQVLKIGFSNLTGLNFHLLPTCLPRLYEIHIDYCDSLDAWTIEKLHHQMPLLKIVYPFYYGDTDVEFRDTIFSVIN